MTEAEAAGAQSDLIVRSPVTPTGHNSPEGRHKLDFSLETGGDGARRWSTRFSSTRVVLFVVIRVLINILHGEFVAFNIFLK